MNNVDIKRSNRALNENRSFKIKLISELQSLPEDIVDKLLSAKGKLNKDKDGKLIRDKKAK